jgi:hypothetical protein
VTTAKVKQRKKDALDVIAVVAVGLAEVFLPLHHKMLAADLCSSLVLDCLESVEFSRLCQLLDTSLAQHEVDIATNGSI